MARPMVVFGDLKPFSGERSISSIVLVTEAGDGENESSSSYTLLDSRFSLPEWFHLSAGRPYSGLYLTQSHE